MVADGYHTIRVQEYSCLVRQAGMLFEEHSHQLNEVAEIEICQSYVYHTRDDNGRAKVGLRWLCAVVNFLPMFYHSFRSSKALVG